MWAQNTPSLSARSVLAPRVQRFLPFGAPPFLHRSAFFANTALFFCCCLVFGRSARRERACENDDRPCCARLHPSLSPSFVLSRWENAVVLDFAQGKKKRKKGGRQTNAHLPPTLSPVPPAILQNQRHALPGVLNPGHDVPPSPQTVGHPCGVWPREAGWPRLKKSGVEWFFCVSPSFFVDVSSVETRGNRR